MIARVRPIVCQRIGIGCATAIYSRDIPPHTKYVPSLVATPAMRNVPEDVACRSSLAVNKHIFRKEGRKDVSIDWLD